MPTPEQARAELARRELERRGTAQPLSPFQKAESRYISFMGPEGGFGSNPAGKARALVQKPFEKAGEFVTEQLGKRQVNPYLSAAAGTAVKMAPDVALTAGPDVAPGGPGPTALGRGLFKQLESASGSMPGSLEAEFKNPGLIFSKGKSVAKPFYQQAMKEIPYEQTLFKGLTKHGEIVEKAVETIEKGGKLEPQEALIARKSLDKAKKAFSEDAFNYYRKILDDMAKFSRDIAQADPLHRLGMMAESLRNFLPQNKYGGASAFKMGIAPALTALGGFLGGPAGMAAGGTIAAGALSPIVQGGAVGTAGVLSRLASNPKLLSALMAYLRNRNQNVNQ